VQRNLCGDEKKDSGIADLGVKLCGTERKLSTAEVAEIAEEGLSCELLADRAFDCVRGLFGVRSALNDGSECFDLHSSADLFYRSRVTSGAAAAWHQRQRMVCSGLRQARVYEGPFQTWTTAEDIALIKSMGFDHVRLSVNPQPMMADHRAGEISAEYFGYLDAAVKMILDQGMAVTIDLHPESDFKTRLAKEDSFVQEFADFWRALARHYSAWDAERVFFEILNEPEFSDRYRWYGVQAKLATAIREGAPQHTIIAAGARWSDDDELVFLEPLRDPNVIYNFHFYDPHIFTHQGATWDRISGNG